MKFFLLSVSCLMGMFPEFSLAQFSCGGEGVISFTGSTTVFPLTNNSADVYKAKCTGTTFIKASGGSSTGARGVCALNPATTTPTDIGNLSREFLSTEAYLLTGAEWQCNGTSRVVIQVPVAVDGLTIITKKNGQAWNKCLKNRTVNGVKIGGLSGAELRWAYTNLAGIETDPQYTVNLPYVDGDVSTRWWSEIDKWCNKTQRIKITGPNSTFGTNTFFREILMTAPGENIRSDIVYLPDNSDAMRDYVFNNDWSIGFMGYSYAAFNDQTLQIIPINGVAPNNKTLTDQSYSLFARRIYQNLWKDDTSLAKTKCFSDFIFTKSGKKVVTNTQYVPIPEIEWDNIKGTVPGTCKQPDETKAPAKKPTRAPKCFCFWLFKLLRLCCTNGY